MTTITQTISSLSTPPSKSDPTNFDDRADAFLAELPDLADEINAWATEANTVAGEVSDGASTATTQAAAAVAAVGISAWVDSTTYAAGDTVYGTDGHSYRAVQANTDVDPVSDSGAYWTCLTKPYSGGFKNKLINGNFDIWQRGTEQTASGYGSADRWINHHEGTATKTVSRQEFTVGQTEVPNNPKYFLRTVVSNGGDTDSEVVCAQRIEDVRTCAGKTVTCSFYARTDSAKDIAVDFGQRFSMDSEDDRVTAIGTQAVSLTTEWQKFTITADIPSISGKTIGTDGYNYLVLNFRFSVGATISTTLGSYALGNQTGTFDIAQVQLEEGSVATNFEQRHIGQELALCQRYFEIIRYVTGNTVSSVVCLYYKVIKRDKPSVTLACDLEGTADTIIQEAGNALSICYTI